MMRTADIKGTTDWLLERVDPAVELRIRQELRALDRVVAADVVALVLRGGRHDGLLVISAVGDRRALPASGLCLQESVPTFVDVRTTYGEIESAVIQGVVIGRGIDSAILVVVAPQLGTAELLGVIEESGARLEETLVAAVCATRPTVRSPRT